MVVCNAARFLPEAIDSILAQSFEELEFIIVDFGSTDESRSIIQSYAARDSRVKVHSIPNCSLADARNVSCFLAKGRYLAIMDADDVSAVNRLKLEFEFMEKNPETGLLGGATEWIDPTGKLLCTNYLPSHDDAIRTALLTHNPFCQSSVLIRREAFERVSGYRSAFAPSEDYDLWLRIADHFHCAILDQIVLKYRIHPYQISLRKRHQQSLCAIAARVAALARRDGSPDPFDYVTEITPAVLAGLGVSEEMQQQISAREHLQWVNNMRKAGEYSAALDLASELLQSPGCKHADRWVLADLRLLVAQLYWKQKNFPESMWALAHAVVTRPIMLGRPLKRLLRWKARLTYSTVNSGSSEACSS